MRATTRLDISPPAEAARPSAALVVDDDKDMCWALEIGLTLAGFATLGAGCAEAALALLARQQFDVAFVDARLPDMEGFHLVGELRRRQPKLITILISGYYFADDQRISDALDSGIINGFLAKPFRIDAAIGAANAGHVGNPRPANAGKMPAPREVLRSTLSAAVGTNGCSHRIFLFRRRERGVARFLPLEKCRRAAWRPAANRNRLQRKQSMARIQKATNSSSLAEVVDRILDKGIVIDAWVRVSLVGIELITIEARVVVASVETYLKYAEAVGLTASAATPA